MRKDPGIRQPGLALVVSALILSGQTHAAPQTFNTALPVGKGNVVYRAQVLYRKAGGDSSSPQRDVEVRGMVSALGYGVSRDFALFGVLPYLHKELDLTVPGGRRLTRSTSGIGDAQVFGRYTVFHRDSRGSTFRIAPFLGMEIPTGDDDDSDRLGRLPRLLQPGSGSWDPMGGAVATYQTLDYQLDAQLSYKANTEANDFEPGDELRLDASLQYRVLPHQLGAGVPGFLYGVLEANFLHRAEDKTGGDKDADSGGTVLHLSPGLQYVTRKWIAELIVQLPVSQNLRGTAPEDDYTVRAGFRVNF